MKTLIENSIRIFGLQRPNQVNIFTNPELKRSARYANLLYGKGITFTILFNYKEGSEVKSSRIVFTIPTDKTEEEIKTMIIDAINNSLNN